MTIWKRHCVHVYECLMSVEKGMMELYDEYMRQGNFSEAEILATLFESRLRMLANDAKDQRDATLTTKRLLRDLEND